MTSEHRSGREASPPVIQRLMRVELASWLASRIERAEAPDQGRDLRQDHLATQNIFVPRH